MYKVYEIKQRVFESNEQLANTLRADLKREKTFLLNLMSSPGAGKTTTLTRTIEALKDEMSVGVMPSDSQSGFPTFMGVSMKTQGFSVANVYSQKMEDQSVMRASASKMDSLELKSCSKYSSSSG